MAYYIFAVEGKLAIVKERGKQKAENRLRKELSIANPIQFLSRQDSFTLATTVYGFFSLRLI